MRGEEVWTQCDNTEFQAWIEAESRRIEVTREAIQDFLRLPPDAAATMPPEGRREFVRDHLSEIIAAVHDKIDPSDRTADFLTVRTGELQEC